MMVAFLAATLSGILLFLSFPTFDYWPLAWAGLVPLISSLDRLTLRQSFLTGWWTGIVQFLGVIYWVTHSMEEYGQIPPALSILFLLLLVVYLGLYHGVFALLVRWTRPLAEPFWIVAGASGWVALEWLRGHLLTGFPWALLGYSQYAALPVVQIADIAGVYGVSFLLAVSNLALTGAVRSIAGEKPLRARLTATVTPLGIGLALTALTLAYGYQRLETLQAEPPGDRLRVALIQGNIDQALKWDPAYQRTTLDLYRSMTLEAKAAAAAQPVPHAVTPEQAGLSGQRTPPLDLVIWPETATPFFFEADSEYRGEILALARTIQTPLLFGSPAVEPPPSESGRVAFNLYNSAYLVSATGQPVARYDKIHLVPFGEYVPLARLLFFVQKLVEGIGDFKPGSEYTIMETDKGLFGVVICFEVIFPDLVRQFKKAGADYMVTLTNDAWFGRTSAPDQHFSMVVLRAVENRVPFLRAANTGISGYIEPTGRIKSATPLFTRTFRIEDVRLTGFRSFYAVYGDIFAYLCVIITLVAVISRRKPRSS